MGYISGYDHLMSPGQDVVITTGHPESAAIQTNGLALCGILFPAAMTGASVSFKASLDGITFFPIRDNAGDLLSYALTVSTYLAINPVDFYGVKWLQILSASTELGTRTLKCSFRGF